MKTSIGSGMIPAFTLAFRFSCAIFPNIFACSAAVGSLDPDFAGGPLAGAPGRLIDLFRNLAIVVLPL